MKIHVHELDGDIYQEVKPATNQNVEAIRVHLYKHASPAGAVKVQIKDQENQLIAESNSLTITDISDATYFHGFVTFNLNVHLQKDQTYRVYIVVSGYAFSEASYLGVCTDFDHETLDRNYTIYSNGDTALALQFWSRK